MKCFNCEKETNNPKFCSRSCSATYTNKIQAKRKRTKKCIDCDNLILADRKHCSKCWEKKRQVDLSLITMKEMRGRQRYQKHSGIRGHARKIYEKSDRRKACYNCGYSKHIEICHIKPLKDFPLTSKISEVNALENLIALCPNCHWEFDNGILSIEDMDPSGFEPETKN